MAAINYTLQASLALALLYAIYWLFLGRTGFHQLNRFVLIGIAIASLLLPLASRLIPNLTPGSNIIADGYVKYTAPLQHGIPIALDPKSSSIPIALILTAIYLLGLTICLIRLITPILTLIKIIRKNPKSREKDYTLVELKESTPPFSFFIYIFLHRENYSEAQKKNILLHEQVHIKQYHTVDILFMELFAAVAWFHPIAWRLNTQTKLNLEYLADHELLATGVERKEYQYQLLQLTVGPSLSRMANYFNQSHLQKRIAMINSNTRRTNIWRYILFLPALIACSLTFGSLKAQLLPDKDNTDIYLVIRSGITEARIHQIETELAADGITLAITNLAYTDSHQLSGFRLTLSQSGKMLEDITINPDGQPISEPVVVFWLRSRKGVHGGFTRGLTRGLPPGLDKKDRKIIENLDGLLRKNPETNEFDLHGSARLGD